MKGALMIASPCKNCERRYLSKEDCVKSCKILNDIKDLELSTRHKGPRYNQDYDDTTILPAHLPKTSQAAL